MALAISSFEPTAAAAYETVSIYGTDMENVSVRFNGVLSGSVTGHHLPDSGPAYVKALVPPGASTGSITVTKTVGSGSAISSVPFTFVPFRATLGGYVAGNRFNATFKTEHVGESAGIDFYLYEVDWGDDSEPATGTTTSPSTALQHDYAEPGGYDVVLTIRGQPGDVAPAPDPVHFTAVIAPVVVTPGVPADLQVEVDAAGISLDWTSGSPTGTSYDIYRGTASGALGFLANTAVSAYLDAVANLVAGVRYYYHVVARSGGLTSAPSTERGAVAQKATAPSGAPPAAPDGLAFVSMNAAGTSVRVRTPPLPAGATSLSIYKKLKTSGTYLFVRGDLAGNSLASIPELEVPQTYLFRVGAHNAAGVVGSPLELLVETNAGLTGESEVDEDAPAPTVEWVAPADGEALGGRCTLVVRVTSENGLSHAAPVSIAIDGGALSTELLSGDHTDGQWRADFDFGAAQWQGALTARATATGRNGAQSYAERGFTVNSGLNNGVVWHDDVLVPVLTDVMEAKGLRITKAMATADFQPAESPTLDRYWTVQMISPDPGPLDLDSTLEELLEDTKAFQPLDLDTLVPMVGGTPAATDSGYAIPDATLRVRFIGTPTEKFSTWTTGCTTIPKMRPFERGLLDTGGTEPEEAVLELELLGLADGEGSRSAWFNFGKDGLVPVYDFTDGGYEGVLDAARAGDKLHVVTEEGITVIDLDPQSVDEFRRPANEDKPAKFVEHAGAFVYWFYADDEMTTVYRRTATDAAPVDSTDLDSEVVTTYSDGSLLWFSLADGRIFKVTAGAAPALLWTHTAPVTALAALTFGDESGRIYNYENLSPVADLAPALRALSLFRGADSAARGVAAGESAQLFRAVAGVYVPMRTLPGATAIPSLGRMQLETAPAQGGGALQGGTDAVISEWLVGGTASAPGQAYVWRLEESTPRPLRGQSVGNIALKVMGKAKVATHE